MTRINLVEPSQLTNPHLMAEYRELPRILTAVEKLAAKGKTPNDVNIPKKYCLGKGHVTFFWNKVRWLYVRYTKIYFELTEERGYKLNEEKYNKVCNRFFNFVALHDSNWSKSYQPTPEEIYINMARLVRRSTISEVHAELGTYTVAGNR